MPKYQIGEDVVYGINGACRIVEIGSLSFAGPDKIYYSMKPVCDGRSTIYLPITKEDEIKRRVMSKEEAEKIVEKAKKIKAANYEATRDICDPILKSGDNIEISKMIKMLRNLRKENRKNHKGLNIQEDKILRDAEIIYFSELASVFDMTMDEVISNYSSDLDD